MTIALINLIATLDQDCHSNLVGNFFVQRLGDLYIVHGLFQCHSESNLL